MSKKKFMRVEQIMLGRGLAPSLERARALILAGEVFIAQTRVQSGALCVDPETEVMVRAESLFVSRGGLKLDHAIKSFDICVKNRICADVGAATGGFSDVLLQSGAARVYAVDVGYGDLHWKVRSNSKVIPIERTNARYLESLPERVALIAVDVSFISIALLLNNFGKWLLVGGDLIILIKPQFEAAQEEVDRGEGVVTDPLVHRRILNEVLDNARKQGFSIHGLIRSPILGAHGNAEFLVWLKNGGEQQALEVEEAISPLFP